MEEFVDFHSFLRVGLRAVRSDGSELRVGLNRARLNVHSEERPLTPALLLTSFAAGLNLAMAAL